jgi:hypothetical protein
MAPREDAELPLQQIIEGKITVSQIYVLACVLWALEISNAAQKVVSPEVIAQKWRVLSRCRTLDA